MSNRIFIPSFTGPLSKQLIGFFQEKRMSGIKYSSEAWRLLQIDKLSININVPKDTLTKELFEIWCKRTSTESVKTWKARMVVISQLSKYFINNNYPCYKTQIEYNSISNKSAFIPHIFTDKELKAIFNSADNLNSPLSSQNRRDVSSLLFRTLYSCGLRIDEALSLLIKDVDFEKGVFTIFHAKNNIPRYVPMSKELLSLCNSYKKKVLNNKKDNSYFFASPTGSKYSMSTIHYMWFQILKQSKIQKDDNGPRIHDLRHTFAVHCLKKWVDKNMNINSLLPVLSTYMGHKSMSSVNKYLRLTADVYPNITNSIEKYFGYIIPDGGYLNEEE